METLEYIDMETLKWIDGTKCPDCGYLNDEQKGTYLTLKQRQIDIDIENLRRYNYVKSYCFLFNEVHGNICKIYERVGLTEKLNIYN